MRYFAAFCVPVEFTYFRSDSQKMRKSGQIADVCSSQIVVKIRGFTTKDFAEENQRFYYNTDFWFCIVPMSISGLWQMGVHLCTPITILSHHSEHFLCFLPTKLIHLPEKKSQKEIKNETILCLIYSWKFRQRRTNRIL